tara:strand:- start:4863 stop:5474 length:612 start_codon:yes stop_codon:yes gene_type:complete
MNERHAYYLKKMDIDVWVKRDQDDLACLAKKVAKCTLCKLHTSRTQTVFARGNPQASLMIIGEAPGFNEDKQGLPFVGKAGQLLNSILTSMNFDEQDIYITNLIKCRPPENRNPHIGEINSCAPYLDEQIKQVAPKLLLALGRFSAHFLTNQTQPLAKLRSIMHHYHSIPCLVSYHPAYLLRNPQDKKKAYTDWQEVKAFLNQ